MNLPQVTLPSFIDQFDLSHWTGHILSIVAIMGAFLGLIPSLAASAALIWYGIQIWESRTVQHAFQNWRAVRQATRVLRLRAQAKVLVAKIEAAEKIRLAKREARELVEDAATTAKTLVAQNNVLEQIKSNPEK